MLLQQFHLFYSILVCAPSSAASGVKPTLNAMCQQPQNLGNLWLPKIEYYTERCDYFAYLPWLRASWVREGARLTQIWNLSTQFWDQVLCLHVRDKTFRIKLFISLGALWSSGTWTRARIKYELHSFPLLQSGSHRQNDQMRAAGQYRGSFRLNSINAGSPRVSTLGIHVMSSKIAT